MPEVLTRRLGQIEVAFEPRPGTADGKVVWEVWDDLTYEWEPHQVAHRAVLDLGANIGAFSVWAATAGAAVVRAVEPEPENFNRLVAHINANLLRRVIDPVHAAAGPEPVYRIESHPHGASSWTMPVPGSPPGRQVQGRSLASLMDGLGDSVIVKCDIEGAEYALFETAALATLRDIDLLALEWHTPGVEGGLGARPFPEDREWPVGDLIRRLSEHHRVTVHGEPHAGGMLWAVRY